MASRFDPAACKVGDTIYLAEGSWEVRTVSEYAVAKITPGGQIVAERQLRPDYTSTIRINKHGNIVGDGGWSRRSIVTADDAAEIRAEAEQRTAWLNVRDCAVLIDKAGRNRDVEALDQAIALLSEKRKAVK